MVSSTPLQKIRRQTALRQRLSAVSNVDSAYSRLQKTNGKLKNGRNYRTADEVDSFESKPPTMRRKTTIGTFSVGKKKPKAKPKSKSKAPPKPETEEDAVPEVECWQAAGGYRLPTSGGEEEEPNDTLGVARVSTWRREAFVEALRALIAKHAPIEDLATEELLHGGESVSDVYVRFRSELVAEAVKAAIDGEMVEGRKLQVKYV